MTKPANGTHAFSIFPAKLGVLSSRATVPELVVEDTGPTPRLDPTTALCFVTPPRKGSPGTNYRKPRNQLHVRNLNTDGGERTADCSAEPVLSSLFSMFNLGF